MKIAYTIKETAEMLGCGMNKTYELVHSKKLNSFQFGKKLMIPVQSIEQLVKSQEVNHGR
jgi:excisionase family DNA binding protein|tara:strand:+ start:530 stop:709 length:180 start_codon:yes stop_codon:yes gene_type:complete